MKQIKATTIVSLAALALFAQGCSKERAISVARQGVFSSGGSVTEAVPGAYDETKNWLDATRAGNTVHVDHANVFFQIPAKEKGLPLVFLHGYGQSRMGWQTTPDGREGWSDFFLRAGHSVFLVDQPRRGAAGMTAHISTAALDMAGADGKSYNPGDQAWYTHFRIGRIAPDRYEGSQFPAGDEAQNQFFRQMTVNTGDYDEILFGQSLGAALSDVQKMTGKKSVYVTHSQGGRVGWQTPAENIAAIVAVEPGGTPQAGSPEYQKFLEARVPVLVIFGDYIDNGPADIHTTQFWKAVRDGADAFAAQYTADGGTAEVWDLPKMGITGNSHFLFQELNNKEIAALIEQWIGKNVK